MIKSKNARRRQKIEIDLTGPEGNAFVLLGHAEDLAKKTNKDSKAIRKEMMSSNYEHLLKVFEREFGDFVTLYR
jgi:hypothetical protein